MDEWTIPSPGENSPSVIRSIVRADGLTVSSHAMSKCTRDEKRSLVVQEVLGTVAVGHESKLSSTVRCRYVIRIPSLIVQIILYCTLTGRTIFLGGLDATWSCTYLASALSCQDILRA